MDQQRFVEKAIAVGACVKACGNIEVALEYIKERTSSSCLVPKTELVRRHSIVPYLERIGVKVITENFREREHIPGAGVTFANFAMADTGTLVLESTSEDIRLATSLPNMHFVLLDPSKILVDNLAAIKPMEDLQNREGACCIAYITGPSRTADIERVLTIGCHGPKELHILLVPNISSSFFEI